MMRQRLFLVVMLALPFFVLALGTPSAAQQQEQNRLFLPLLQQPRPLETIYIAAPLPANSLATVLDIWVMGAANAAEYSVTVRVEDRVVALSLEEYICERGGCTYAWHGKLSLEGLARAEYLLKAEAVDRLGRVARAELPYFYNQLPGLTIHSPQPYDTASPTLQLHATCTDDNPEPCQSIQVVVLGGTAPSVIVAETSGSVLSDTVSLEPWLGQSVNVSFVATDASGAQSVHYPHFAPQSLVFVSAPSLRMVEEVPGRIVDADATRLVYVGDLPQLSLSDHTGTLILRDRATGQETVIQEDVVERGTQAKLFAQGVLFASSAQSELYEWRNGVITSLGGYYPHSLIVRGAYASWQGPTAGMLRELDNRLTHEVFVNTCTQACAFDLAANGDLVYTWPAPPDAPNHLFRYRDGQSTQLSPADATWSSSYPKTDGESIVYLHSSAGVMLRHPDAEIALGTMDSFYLINNGWVAFARRSTTPSLWLRTRDGTEREIALPEDIDWARPISLGPTGGLIYQTVEGYFAVFPTAPDRSIFLHNTFYANTIWLEDSPFLLVGNGLFEIQE